jgi:uncharacterized protein (UPF0335 family)
MIELADLMEKINRIEKEYEDTQSADIKELKNDIHTFIKKCKDKWKLKQILKLCHQ